MAKRNKLGSFKKLADGRVSTVTRSAHLTHITSGQTTWRPRRWAPISLFWKVPEKQRMHKSARKGAFFVYGPLGLVNACQRLELCFKKCVRADWSEPVPGGRVEPKTSIRGSQLSAILRCAEKFNHVFSVLWPMQFVLDFMQNVFAGR